MSPAIASMWCGGTREHVGRRHPEGGSIGHELGNPPIGQDVDRLARISRALDDPIVDVREVHDPGHAQPAIAQVSNEQVGEQEGPEVPDVGRSIDRRAAAVDAGVAGIDRLEGTGLPGQRVLEAQAHDGRTGAAPE